MTLAFWLFAVPAAGTKSRQPSLPLVYAQWVFVGTITWVVGYGAALAVLRRFEQRWWLRFADLAGGLILPYFAAATAFAAFGNISIIR